MIDYSIQLYDPVYMEFGVPATFTTGSTAVDISVIDDTRPKVVPAGTNIDVRGTGPGAFARIPELQAHGIVQSDWLQASLSFNGRTWTVRAYDLLGNPNGEDFGEVRFLLKANAIG